METITVRGQHFKKSLASTSSSPSFTITFGSGGDIPNGTKFFLCGFGWEFPQAAAPGQVSYGVSQGGVTYAGGYFSSTTPPVILPVPMVFESSGGAVTVYGACAVNGNSRNLWAYGYWA